MKEWIVGCTRIKEITGSRGDTKEVFVIQLMIKILHLQAPQGGQVDQGNLSAPGDTHMTQKVN